MFNMNFSNVTTAHASTIIEHKMMRTYIVLIGSRSHFDWLKYSFPSSLHSLTRISKWGLADRLANPEKKVRHHTAISERVLPIFFSNGRHLGFIRQQGHSAQGLGYMLSYPVSTVIGSLKFYWGIKHIPEPGLVSIHSDVSQTFLIILLIDIG